jgi:hypothetical protein
VSRDGLAAIGSIDLELLICLLKGEKMEVELKNKKLIITIPVNDKPIPSASGKTLVVASSHGNQKTAVTINGKAVIVGVNAYIQK